MQLNDFDNYAIRGLGVNGFTLDSSVINASAKNDTSAAVDEGGVSLRCPGRNDRLDRHGKRHQHHDRRWLRGTLFSVFNSSGTLTLSNGQYFRQR